MWWDPQENVTYGYVLTSPAVFCIPCLTYLDGFRKGGRWLYSCCFVGCCFQDLFNIACIILVQFLSSFFSIYLVSIHMVHPYNCIDTTAAWKKKLHFILSDRSDIQMTHNLLVAVHAFAMLFSVDEMLLPR